MDDDSNTNKPRDEGADVETALVPVWTGRVAIVERGDVDVALADDEVVHSVIQTLSATCFIST